MRYAVAMQPFETLATSWKQIAVFPGWSEPEPETGYVWFDAPLEIGGVTERAFVLHGGCYSDHADCHVSLEVRISKVPGRRCIPLMRLDWRSLEGGHQNPRREGSPVSGHKVSDTHLHAFDLNYNPTTGRMRGKALRMAMEIDQDLQSVDDVLRYAGNAFRISNITIVVAPPWRYNLL